MNIFAVDRHPWVAATMLGDRHITKMTLESAQMLCSAFPPGVAPYKAAYANHPCTVWTRQSFENFEWLCHHGIALADEYTHRFGGRVHKSRAVIEWCWHNAGLVTFPEQGLKPFAQAMPDQFKQADSVAAYRHYYRVAKAHLHKWTNSCPPTWVIMGSLAPTT